jgi:hypothetical protein
MSSEKKVIANQENALRSTGPKTSEGKAVVRFNAVKHGLLSRGTLLPTEDAKELAGLSERLRAQLVPEGELELLLVDRVVVQSHSVMCKLVPIAFSASLTA